MPARDRQTDAPIVASAPPKGRPADRIAAMVAGFALFASVAGTLWFFSGFFETDPGFGPASSAFLVSIGLGAFAIIPSAVILRLSVAAWRAGFRPLHGWWTLLLAAPWIGLAVTSLRSDWLPWLLGILPLLIAVPLILWAIVSLWLERPRQSGN